MTLIALREKKRKIKEKFECQSLEKSLNQCIFRFLDRVLLSTKTHLFVIIKFLFVLSTIFISSSHIAYSMWAI